MGNISASFFLPSPKTTCYRILYWTSRRLGWKDFEFSDHNRGVIKATVAVHRANAPAATLRRRLHDKLNRQPNTMGVLWTNSNDITTALTLSIENRNNGVEIFHNSQHHLNPEAHWLKHNLFSQQHWAKIIHHTSRSS